MATLHLVNRRSALQACLSISATGDAIVLIEDGVYSVLESLPVKVYAIEDDVRARGLTDHLLEGTRMINFSNLVELVTTHLPIVSWD